MSSPLRNKSADRALTATSLCLGAIILVFIALSALRLDRPGLQHDEILFGNAALGGIDGSFIAFKIGDFPVLLMTYIGALKAYIYYPVFKVFQVSPYSIRIPVIIIGSLTLLFTFKYAQCLFGKKTAFLTVIFLAFDPSFLFQNRLDWGPVSLSLFLKSLALFFLIKGVKSGEKKFFAFSLLSLGLGLFNKLDFIWFINALALSGAVVFHREAVSFSRKNMKTLLIVSLALVCFVFLFYLYVLKISSLSINPGGPFASFGFLEKFRSQASNLRQTLNGNSAYWFMTGTNLGFKSLFLIVGGALVALSIAIRVFLKGAFDRKEAFFAFVTAFILAQIYITREGGGTHHMMMIYPFPHLIAAFSAVKIIDSFNEAALKRLAASLVCIAVGAVVISNFHVYRQYMRAFTEDRTTVMWSGGIYNLIDYVNAHKDKTYVSVDWGFHNHLVIFTQGTVTLKEMLWEFNGLDTKGEAEGEQLAGEVCAPGRVFLFHEDSVSHFIKAKRNFFDLAGKHDIKINPVARLGNGDKYYYELYEADQSSCLKMRPFNRVVPAP